MTRKKILLLSLAGVVLLAVVGWNGYGWWLKHKLERYKSYLTARGEKLTLRELVADSREPEFNSADLFTRAMVRLRGYGIAGTNPPVAMRLIVPGRAMIGWRQPLLIGREPWRSKLPLTNTWEELAENLAESQEGIELLHQITAHPDLDFRLDYTIGPTLMLPHLAPMKQSAQVLSAATLLALHQGDPAAAAQHIRAMLALVKGAREERTVISQLVSLAIVQIATSATWELLQAPDVAEADLRAIQADFTGLNFRRSMERAFEVERAMGGMTIRHYREQGGIFDLGSMPGGGGGTASTNFADQFKEHARRTFSPEELRKNSSELLWQSALSYEDELRLLQSMEVMIDGLRSASNRAWVEVIGDTKSRLEAAGLMPRDEGNEDSSRYAQEDSLASVRAMFSGAGSWALKSLNKVELAEVNFTLVTTAIALKRHQLRHGQVPGELTALVPEFLEVPPRDPVDGKPLRYRLQTDDQWLLYSIAEDGVDDGGDPKPTSYDPSSKTPFRMIKGRDWVWPQPASLEEILAWETDKSRQN